MGNISPDTIARIICLLIALLNQFLAIFGKGTLDIVENDIYQLVSLGATIITAIIACWKNNSVTKEAIEADNYLKKLRDKSK